MSLQKGEKKVFACHVEMNGIQCTARFSRRQGLRQHVVKEHNIMGHWFDCAFCGLTFASPVELHRHVGEHEPNPEFKKVHNLFDGACVVYRRIYVPSIPSLQDTILKDADNIIQLMTLELAQKQYVKFCMVAMVEYVRIVGEEVVGNMVHFARSINFNLTLYQEHSDIFRMAFNRIDTNVEDVLQGGSDWVLNAVHRVDLEFGQCQSLNGSCGAEVRVNNLRDVRHLQFIHNDKKDCFFHSVAAAFTCSNSRFVTEHFIKHTMNTAIRTPVGVNDIPKFERLNRSHLKVAVNVIMEEEGTFYPVYFSVEEHADFHVTLLLYKTNEGKECHYVYCEDLNKLLRKRYRCKNGHLSYQNRFFCNNCLCCFSTPKILEEHRVLCRQKKTQKVVLPKTGDTLQFKNYMKKFEVPLIAFFDFEAIQKDPQSHCIYCQTGQSDDPDIAPLWCEHAIAIDAVQEAITYSLLVLKYDGSIVHQNVYTGEDCADAFIAHLLDLEPALMNILKAAIPMRLTRREQREFNAATHCHICEKPIIPREGEEGGFIGGKVRDHNHIK